MEVLNKTKIYEKGGKKYVSIRDYELARLARSDKPEFAIRVGKNVMTLKTWELVGGERLTKKQFRSKYNPDQFYYLYDLEFIPDIPKETEEDWLKRGLI